MCPDVGPAAEVANIKFDEVMVFTVRLNVSINATKVRGIHQGMTTGYGTSIRKIDTARPPLTTGGEHLRVQEGEGGPTLAAPSLAWEPAASCKSLPGT